MGFLGSSKNKPRDPFQAAVKQQRRRTPAARLRERRSESARQYNAGVFHRGPFAWHGDIAQHPYQQPRFGFYSGENLVAGRSRQAEGRRTMSVGQGFTAEQQGFLGDALGGGLSFLTPPLHGVLPFSNTDNYVADVPWTDLGPDISAGPWNSYAGRANQFHYPGRHNLDGYDPISGMNSLNGPTPGHGLYCPPRRMAVDVSRYSDLPAFDNSRLAPNLGTIPTYNRIPPLDRLGSPLNAFTSTPKDSLSGARAVPLPPRPPGSYERLRPPHLQGRP